MNSRTFRIDFMMNLRYLRLWADFFQNLPPALDSIKEKAYIGYYCQFCMAVELIHNRMKKILKDLSVYFVLHRCCDFITCKC